MIREFSLQEDVNNKLSIVKLTDLFKYERTSEHRVVQLINKIKNSGILINPIVWDKNRQLLIDGHHRVKAFEMLGIESIPAFHVDYLSKDVQILPWYRIIHPHSVNRVADLFQYVKFKDDTLNFKGLLWTVCANEIDGSEILCRKFNSAFEAAEFNYWFYQICNDDGFKVEISAEEPKVKWENSNSFYVNIYPVIGKNEVLFASQNSILFPPQVNRHTIKNRIINLTLPLDILLGRKKDVNEKFIKHINHKSFLHNKKSIWFDQRYYQESTIQLI